jgi:hypothetical protein
LWKTAARRRIVRHAAPAKELASDDAAVRWRRCAGRRDLRAALTLDDTVITVKITPNRADCLSMKLAR